MSLKPRNVIDDLLLAIFDYLYCFFSVLFYDVQGSDPVCQSKGSKVYNRTVWLMEQIDREQRLRAGAEKLLRYDPGSSSCSSSSRRCCNNFSAGLAFLLLFILLVEDEWKLVVWMYCCLCVLVERYLIRSVLSIRWLNNMTSDKAASADYRFIELSSQ